MHMKGKMSGVKKTKANYGVKSAGGMRERARGSNRATQASRKKMAIRRGR